MFILSYASFRMAGCFQWPFIHGPCWTGGVESLLHLTTEPASLLPAPNLGSVSRRVLRLLVGPWRLLIVPWASANSLCLCFLGCAATVVGNYRRVGEDGYWWTVPPFSFLYAQTQHWGCHSLIIRSLMSSHCCISWPIEVSSEIERFQGNLLHHLGYNLCSQCLL